MIWPTLELENRLWQQGVGRIAGIDEVGRGCWAGPVAAAVVVLSAGIRLHPSSPHAGVSETFETAAETTPLPRWLRDSKTLNAQQRNDAAAEIKLVAADWSVGLVEAEEIDRVGIGVATFMAMERAVAGLKQPPHFYVVDGSSHPHLPREMQLAQAKADAHIASVAAASIVAKVYRDDLMAEREVVNPGYGFAAHKGYGTALHRQAIERLGFCSEHRRSFAITLATPKI